MTKLWHNWISRIGKIIRSPGRRMVRRSVSSKRISFFQKLTRKSSTKSVVNGTNPEAHTPSKPRLSHHESIVKHDISQIKGETCIQRIVKAIKVCLTSLEVEGLDEQIEAMAVFIHESMSGCGRNFHNIKHIFDVSAGSDDPILVLSALFHDVIYINVDQMLSNTQLEVLRPIFDEKLLAQNKLVLSVPDNDPLLSMIASIFDFKDEQSLDPHKFQGANEFLSAVVAGKMLSDILPISFLAQIAVGIEATIPFRTKDSDGNSSMERLFERLNRVNEDFSLHLHPEEIYEAIRRATELTNRDLENFQWSRTEMFLENTWKLLPESNVPLRRTALYSIFQYQKALKSMLGFFGFLQPEMVFEQFRGYPSNDVLEGMVDRARTNIEFSVSYIGAKLVGLSVLAALAQLTGGDAPLSLFMGDLPSENPSSCQLENFLLPPTKKKSVEQDVATLLEVGRIGDCTFDVKHSPIAAYLYYELGQEGVDNILKDVVHPMDDEHSHKVLDALPYHVLKNVINGARIIAVTRAKKLDEYLLTKTPP